MKSFSSASQPLEAYFRECSSGGPSLEFSRSSVVDDHSRLTQRLGLGVCSLVAGVNGLRDLTHVEHIREE